MLPGIIYILVQLNLFYLFVMVSKLVDELGKRIIYLDDFVFLL